MTAQNGAAATRQLVRLPTGIAGFDAITGGGLPVRRTCVITGTPGTGKTTFGNQLARLPRADCLRMCLGTRMSYCPLLPGL